MVFVINLLYVTVLLGCIECVSCRSLLLVCAVSVSLAPGSFSVAFAKSFWSLVNVFIDDA